MNIQELQIELEYLYNSIDNIGGCTVYRINKIKELINHIEKIKANKNKRH